MQILRIVYFILAVFTNILVVNNASAIPLTVSATNPSVTFNFSATNTDYPITYDVSTTSTAYVNWAWNIYDENNQYLTGGSGALIPGDNFHDVFSWYWDVSGTMSSKGVTMKIEPRQASAPEPTSILLLGTGLLILGVKKIHLRSKNSSC